MAMGFTAREDTRSDEEKRIGSQGNDAQLSADLQAGVTGMGIGTSIGALAAGPLALPGAIIGGAIGFGIGVTASSLLGTEVKKAGEQLKDLKKKQEQEVLSGIKQQRKRTQKGLLATGGDTGQKFVSASEAADFSSLGPATQYDTLMSRTYGA